MSDAHLEEDAARHMADLVVRHDDPMAGTPTILPHREIVRRLTGEATPEAKDRSTSLLSVSDLASLPEPEFLIEDFVTARGFNILFGPSGCGKSLMAMDWAACIANGLSFYGQTVERAGPVVYIAGEGAFGQHRRLEAWRISRGVSSVEHLYVWPEPVNFYTGDYGEFKSAVDALTIAPVLIVVDTMARCMVGGDENSARDVGLFIDHLDELRATWEAAALPIHHTGKNGELERGSSALRAAADTMVSLKPEGAGLRLTCEKQKDAAEFEPWDFHLEEVGDSVSIRLGTVAGKLAPQEAEILEAVSASFGTDWVSATKVSEVVDVPRTSMYRCLRSLMGRGFIDEEQVGKQRKQYRVTEEGMAAVSDRPNPSHGTAPKPSHPSPISRDGMEGR